MSKRNLLTLSKRYTTMDLQAAKLDVLQKLMGVREIALLEKIDKLLDSEMIVGYTTDGEPLTRLAYNKRLEKAESQFNSGHFTSQDDLEKESESW